MDDIDTIEKEIDIETNNAIAGYLSTTIQDEALEDQIFDITSDIDASDYVSEKKPTERFLGEI